MKVFFRMYSFGGVEVTVNDAVAKRVVNLLNEKNMTQYRLEQNSGIQHGHMQWIMSGKSRRYNRRFAFFGFFVISDTFGS